jgi:hypothetical protein
MLQTRPLAVTTCIFAVAGLIGPFVRIATWPPSQFSEKWPQYVSAFVNDLLFLVWPTQMLAVIESSTEFYKAAAVAITSNIVLFVCAGWLFYWCCRSTFRLSVMLTVLLVALTLWGMWGAGFDISQLNWVALTVAASVWSLPFLLSIR